MTRRWNLEFPTKRYSAIQMNGRVNLLTVFRFALLVSWENQPRNEQILERWSEDYMPREVRQHTAQQSVTRRVLTSCW